MDWKEEVKLSLFIDDTIVYTEKSQIICKNATRNNLAKSLEKLYFCKS